MKDEFYPAEVGVFLLGTFIGLFFGIIIGMLMP